MDFEIISYQKHHSSLDVLYRSKKNRKMDENQYN